MDLFYFKLWAAPQVLLTLMMGPFDRLIYEIMLMYPSTQLMDVLNVIYSEHKIMTLNVLWKEILHLSHITTISLFWYDL